MIFLSSISQKLISILPNKWKSLKITREILVLKECRNNLIFLYISVFVMTKKQCHLPEAWILNKMEFSGSGKERDIRVQTAHNEKMVVISGNKRTNTSLDWTGGFIQYSCRNNRHLRSRKKYTNRKKPTGISSYHILVTRVWVQQMQNQPQILSRGADPVQLDNAASSKVKNADWSLYFTDLKFSEYLSYYMLHSLPPFSNC